VFFEMQHWLHADGSVRDALGRASCIAALHRLCAENLSAGAVRRAAAEEHAAIEAFIPADDAAWVSDGGLGAIFTTAGLPVPLAEARP
jgi:hypothetical protein